MCPSGWEWEGDWEMSKVLQAFAQGKASDAFNYKEVNLQLTKILNPTNFIFDRNVMRLIADIKKILGKFLSLSPLDITMLNL